MAEQNQIDFSKLEGVTPFNSTEQVEQSTSDKQSIIQTEQPSIDVSKLEEEEVTPVKEQPEIDFSKLEGVTSVKEQPEIDFSKLEGVTFTTKSEQPSIVKEEEPSWFRKFLYGFDKQDQFFGNVFRIGKAKFQDIRDDNRDLQQVLQDNAGVENQQLLNRFNEFRNKKYDDDIYVKAGEVASMLLDPFYLLAYLTPWGRAASASYKGLAVLGGTTVGLDKLISDYTKTGEFKPTDAAISAGSAAVLGPAGMKVFKTIGKYLPGADKKKIAQVISAAEGSKAKQLGISNSEFKKISEIVGDKEFITINNLIKNTGENYSKPFKKLTFDFDKKYDNLKKIISQLQDLNTTKFTKKTENKINTLISKKDELLKQFKLDKKELVKKQSNLLQKEIELTNKRDVKILEKLRQNESLTDTTLRYVLSASARPLFGAGVGYAFGTLWGADDDDLNKWIWGGALLGGLQKGIQASKVLQVGDKTAASNILNNEAVKLTLQNLREITATTTATKLKAFGGKTEELGNILLQNLDSPYAKNSISKVADEIQRTWTMRAVKLVSKYNSKEKTNALNSLRGSKITLTNNEQVLKRNIQNYLDDFKTLYNDAGIFAKQNIDDYFPRVYDFNKIQKNPKAFEEALIKIFKNKKVKNPIDEAKKFQSKLNDVSNFNIVRSNIDDLINDKKISNNYIITPLSNHINQQRKLTGSFNDVEKILSDGGFLINDPAQVLSSLVNRSANSIAFAQRFGPNGQFLTPFFQGIKDKYKNTGKTNWRELAQKEIQVVNNTIEAYFDRFGAVRKNQLKATSGILSTISNLNMLDRVTIASLGDLVQPFTNSTNWSTWLRALSQTSLTAKGETGLAKNLALAQGNEIKVALQKPLAITGDEISSHASWLGNDKLSLTAVNNLFFKISGLEWITGFARRFAYNAGASDAYVTSRNFANFVSKGGKINSSKGARYVKDLERYGISIKDSLRIGSNESFDKAAKTSIGKQNLNNAGILAANRDAIIPQVSNRLLFTQSNTPWVRLLGQFLSWSMAKSAQTNKILSRIENGDTRTMVKLLAALPVYGGIQELRELAKYGEVKTDIDADTDDWWSEAIRLSGLPGVAPEFLASNLIGPGSRQPFFLAFPAGSIAYESDKILRDFIKGNTDRATERFFQRVFPLPTWRRFITERVKDVGIDLTDTIFDSSPGRKLPETKLERKPFATGDLVTQDKGIGKLASKILTSGVTAELLKDTFSNSPQKFNTGGEVILPERKPTVKNVTQEAEQAMTEGSPKYYNESGKEISLQQMQKEIADERKQDMKMKDAAKIATAAVVATGIGSQMDMVMPKKKPAIEINYSKVPELEPAKKEFLFDAAEKIYKTNIEKKIPDSVLLAIAAHESGWGTSRFYKEGNNYFNTVKEGDEEFIQAKQSKQKVSKHATPEENVQKLLTWIETKPHYQVVRDALESYNQGEATKNDIIDAIAKTGFAQDTKWSIKVKDTHKNRIEGKNKKELEDLYTSLFSEK